jgi:hypothetical protein
MRTILRTRWQEGPRIALAIFCVAFFLSSHSGGLSAPARTPTTGAVLAEARVHTDSSMTILTTQSSDPVICGNTGSCPPGEGETASANLYSSQGPADKTWVVVVSIGLDSGDDSQYTDFEFQVQDVGTGHTGQTVAFGDAKVNWVEQGLTELDTITIVATGYLTVWYFISNELDANAQQYMVSATAEYF